MTGGKKPEVQYQTVDDKEISNIEQIARLKVSDTSQMAFEIIVPETLLPNGLVVGDIIRVKTVVASTQ